MDETNQTDKSNMINVIESIPEQIAEAIKLAKDVKVTDPVKRIMVAGMGGSAVSGDILKAYLRDKIDVTVNKDYSLPELAGKETLLFIVSYSGNTEETISAFRTAQRKNMNRASKTTPKKKSKKAAIGSLRKKAGKPARTPADQKSTPGRNHVRPEGQNTRLIISYSPPLPSKAANKPKNQK